MGGFPSYLSSVDKCTYSDDTTTIVPAADLSDEVRGQAASASETAGYNICGTNSTANVSIVDKITFADDTRARIPGADATHATRYINYCTNTTTGYFAGGKIPSPNALISTIQKVTYSTDTSSVSPSNLVAAQGYAAGNQSSTAGYFTGGRAGVPPGPDISSTQKLTFATDTAANLPASADLPNGITHIAAAGNATDGYLSGVSTPFPASTIQKINYSTETLANIPGTATDGVAPGGAATSGRGSQQFGTPAPVNC